MRAHSEETARCHASTQTRVITGKTDAARVRDIIPTFAWYYKYIILIMPALEVAGGKSACDRNGNRSRSSLRCVFELAASDGVTAYTAHPMRRQRAVVQTTNARIKFRNLWSPGCSRVCDAPMIPARRLGAVAVLRGVVFDLPSMSNGESTFN